MSRISKRAKLILSEEDKKELQIIAQSRKSPMREIQRANILLKYAEGKTISKIIEETNTSKPTVYKCIDKSLSMGIKAGLKDLYHSSKKATITMEAKMWVMNIACSKPMEHGYAAEIWSRKLLAEYVREKGPIAGYDCLAKASKATVQRILKENEIRPDKIAYYLERRDPDFESKMKDILVVYNEINTWNEKSDNVQSPSIVTVSLDEKPGVQAIQNIAPDILPNPEKNSRIMREHQYKRLGTVSILAALDLNDGHIIAQVHDHHCSKEFILLLKELDAYYASDLTIRIILDNHSIHVSKATLAFLATRPNRFKYIHTPKHGSWLNLIETLFGKMSRTFLKYIRVNSLEELKQRILKGINEINLCPVVHKWKKFNIELKY